MDWVCSWGGAQCVHGSRFSQRWASWPGLVLGCRSHREAMAAYYRRFICSFGRCKGLRYGHVLFVSYLEKDRTQLISLQRQSFRLISLNALMRCFLLLASYFYSFTIPACLFQVVGEVYVVMACFSQPVCFTLLYAVNCCWIWDVLIK